MTLMDQAQLAGSRSARLQAEREARKYKKALTSLTGSIGRALAAIDAVMKERESPERGKRVAKIANELEMANDSVRYSILGVNFRTDKKPKA